MTEDQIERRVESKINAIDRAFMAGRMPQAEYDAAIKSVDEWAKQQYQSLADPCRDALQRLVSWHEDCLNCYLPADQKTARTSPTDDDLCELFNRIEYARRILAAMGN